MKRSKKNRFRIKHRVVQDTLTIELGRLYRVLSSAPRGGGLIRARSILNHQVRANPVLPKKHGEPHRQVITKWSDPARYLGQLALRTKAASPTVGLMTAVPMRRLVKDREQSEGIWVECFCTVGVTNAVRAGEPASHDGSRRCERVGTINIILVTNATLAVPAMVAAVQVATESKTAALLEEKVRSSSGLHLATGTGTDAIVVASSLNGTHRLRYSGTHTGIGSMIGRLVARCVHEGLDRSRRWHESPSPRESSRSTAR